MHASRERENAHLPSAADFSFGLSFPKETRVVPKRHLALLLQRELKTIRIF